MKSLINILYATAITLTLFACNAEDRSGEEPFPPTLRTVSGTFTGDSCLIKGSVIQSPNSHIKEYGFIYGNDTLSKKITSSVGNDSMFQAYTPPLKSGRYYIISYATNGVGTGYGDTLWISKD